MQRTNETNDLAREKIGRLMCRYAIPCAISLLVAALYNIVDQLFIANADYLGSLGNAANTVVFPLTVVALAIAVMIGDGCCAFVSLSLGAGEEERAHRGVGNAVVLAAVSGVALMILYLMFQRPLLVAFGGAVNEETDRLAKEYFTWIALGVPFYMFGQAMNPVIRSDGNPRFAMASTLAGAAVNIVLDPLFIFAFRWGMRGAAIATVLGQVATAVLAVWYLFHTRQVRLRRSSFHLEGGVIRRFLGLGICSFLSQISLVLAMAAIQNMVVKYGALDETFGQPEYVQIPMAVLGIVMKFFQIVISIVVGISAGCIPVVGFSMGAGRKDRVDEILRKLLCVEAMVGLISLLITQLLPRQLIGLFGAAQESAAYTEFAVKSFRTYLCMMILACVNKATFIFLQSMGKPWESMLLSMLREVVLGVLLALILPVFFGLNGVLYSMPVADVLTFVVSVYLIVRTRRELRT